MTDPDLITTIEKAEDELDALITKMPESSDRQTLRNQLNTLRKERDRVLKIALAKESAAYVAANKALEEGIAQVQAAIDDVARVAATINKIAGVITEIGKVAAV